ncbi:O-antigen ligase family protein [candidate division CSSED10-310 bacterium]|uniref:O-antigen ligase family protein n=1 Tax=candidate division CSSED10-310 bacterium TaxID=2855610 RepID=A0ABV6YZ46_UNCC1
MSSTTAEKGLSMYPKIRLYILAVMYLMFVIYLFVFLPHDVVIVIHIGLLLLWLFTFRLERVLTVYDFPLLVLVMGTLVFGRAFSITGLKFGNLEVYITEIVLLLSLAAILLRGKKAWNDWERIVPPKISLLLILYFLMGTVYLIAGYWIWGFKALRDIVFCHYALFILLTTDFLRSSRKLKRVVDIIAPALLFSILYGLIVLFAKGHSRVSLRDLLVDTKSFNVTLYYGLFILFGICFYAYTKRWKIVTILVMYWALLFMILFRVRAGWAGLIVALLFLAVILRKEFLIFVPVFLLVLASLFFINKYNLQGKKQVLHKVTQEIQGINPTVRTNFSSRNAAWRIHLWELYLKQAFQYPLTGRGFGSQPLLDRRITHKQPEISDIGPDSGILPAHNHIIGLTYKMGIMGLLLFTAFNVLVFTHGCCYLSKCKSEYNRRLLIGSLAGLIYWHGIALLFDVLESPPTAIFLWILLGMVLAIVHDDESHVPEQH